MESLPLDCCVPRLALFVGGPADGTLRMIAADEVGMAISHVYLPDSDGATSHMYGAVLGVSAEYRYLGPLNAS